MKNAPVALFAYARPAHLRMTLAALAQNDLASETELQIYCDAARTPAHAAAVEEVRSLATSASGFLSVNVRLRPRNLGLAKSIIAGVAEQLETSDRVIVLEDDMVTSRHFLTFMNGGLERFKDEPRVASIHGYCLPLKGLPPTFFLRGADCWGWATWRRAWRTFDPDGGRLLAQLRQAGLISRFDLDDTYPFSTMLEDQVAGRNDSWAVRWHASAFLAEMLTLHPGRSLVRNIGTDGSGTHGGDTTQFDVALTDAPINEFETMVLESVSAREEYRKFYARATDQRIGRRIVRIGRYVARKLRFARH